MIKHQVLRIVLSTNIQTKIRFPHDICLSTSNNLTILKLGVKIEKHRASKDFVSLKSSWMSTYSFDITLCLSLSGSWISLIVSIIPPLKASVSLISEFIIWRSTLLISSSIYKLVWSLLIWFSLSLRRLFLWRLNRLFKLRLLRWSCFCWLCLFFFCHFLLFFQFLDILISLNFNS